MEKHYLIDTNAAIDYLDNKLPDKGAILIDNNEIKISVITRMELLAWPKATPAQIQVLEDFIEDATVYNLDESIIIKSIEIRKQYSVKLPDAIIAATALNADAILITRNVSDFNNISGLDLLNPWNF